MNLWAAEAFSGPEKDQAPGHAFAEDYRGFRRGAYPKMPANKTINLVTIRQRLSIERMSRYEADASGLKSAFGLYEWNMDASAAFHGLLHGVEVILRNAIHEQMSAWHAASGLTGNWFDDPSGVLGSRLNDQIALARQRIQSQRRAVTPSGIVTELTLGFWRFMLSASFEQTLWTPVLRHCFPHLASRRRADIGKRVERLHHLRNRIAHYEPIYPRRLELDYRDAAFVVAAICAESGAWLEQTTLVTGTLSRRP